MPNKLLFKYLSLLACGAFVLAGCSHYAPGYSGWTTEQVEIVKEKAKARYYKIPRNDTSVLGVNYVNFDEKKYSTYDKVKVTSVRCEGEIYKSTRAIGGVSLKASVCLNSSKEVNRIVLYFIGPNTAATSEVFKIADNEIKNSYGAYVLPGLDNKFITKDKYKSIYFKDSPSENDLMGYDRVLVSDHITSIDVIPSNEASRADGYDRMVFDVKLRDYDAVQKQKALQRSENLKNQLNSIE